MSDTARCFRNQVPLTDSDPLDTIIRDPVYATRAGSAYISSVPAGRVSVSSLGLLVEREFAPFERLEDTAEGIWSSLQVKSVRLMVRFDRETELSVDHFCHSAPWKRTLSASDSGNARRAKSNFLLELAALGQDTAERTGNSKAKEIRIATALFDRRKVLFAKCVKTDQLGFLDRKGQ